MLFVDRACLQPYVADLLAVAVVDSAASVSMCRCCACIDGVGVASRPSMPSCMSFARLSSQRCLWCQGVCCCHSSPSRTTLRHALGAIMSPRGGDRCLRWRAVASDRTDGASFKEGCAAPTGPCHADCREQPAAGDERRTPSACAGLRGRS